MGTSDETKVRGKIGHIHKTLHPWWTRRVAYLVRRIDDYVKHIFQEHSQEADHLANIGTEGQRKVAT